MTGATLLPSRPSVAGPQGPHLAHRVINYATPARMKDIERLLKALTAANSRTRLASQNVRGLESQLSVDGFIVRALARLGKLKPALRIRSFLGWRVEHVQGGRTENG